MAPDQVRRPVVAVAPRAYEAAQHLLSSTPTNTQLAHQMGITENTVKKMLWRLFRATGVQSRAELVLKLSTGELQIIPSR